MPEPSHTSCPDDATVERLVAGDLAGQEREKILDHAADCDACCELLAALVPAPSTQGHPGQANKGITIDRYRVLDTLGSGGMGTVYCAYDSQLDRRVALKVLREDAAGGEEAARLLREARAMAKLAHPNVVRVFDVGVSDGRVFVAMELAEGGTLRAWLSAGERSWREVLALFCEAGAGLSAAHKAGLVHRDFKPENLLLRDGAVLVTDFGLARSLDGAVPPSSAAPGPRLLSWNATHVAGTPVYMAPEQLNGEPLDARADIFAFSVSLWEALYGARPFSADAPGGLLQAIGDGPPPPKRDRGVPDHVRAALVKGMSFAKERRHATIGELLAACEIRESRGKWLGRAAPWLFGVAALGVAVALAIPRLASSPSSSPPSSVAGLTSSSPVSVPPSLTSASPSAEQNVAIAAPHHASEPVSPSVAPSAKIAPPTEPRTAASSTTPSMSSSSLPAPPPAGVASGNVHVRSSSITLEPFGDAAAPLVDKVRSAVASCPQVACLGETTEKRRGGSAFCRAHVDGAGHVDASTCRSFAAEKETSCHPFERCIAAQLRGVGFPKPQNGAGDITLSFTFVER